MLLLVVVLSSLFERVFGIAISCAFAAIFGFAGFAIIAHGFKSRGERFFDFLGGLIFVLVAVQLVVRLFDQVIAHKLVSLAFYITWGLIPIRLFLSYRNRRKIVDPMASLQAQMIGKNR